MQEPLDTPKNYADEILLSSLRVTCEEVLKLAGEFERLQDIVKGCMKRIDELEEKVARLERENAGKARF
jgi:hypothetical protein